MAKASEPQRSSFIIDGNIESQSSRLARRRAWLERSLALTRRVSNDGWDCLLFQQMGAPVISDKHDLHSSMYSQLTNVLEKVSVLGLPFLFKIMAQSLYFQRPVSHLGLVPISRFTLGLGNRSPAQVSTVSIYRGQDIHL